MAEENDALLKQVRRRALALINSYLSNQLAVTFSIFWGGGHGHEQY